MENRNSAFKPLQRVLQGVFDFSGRSTRTDGVLYYILVVLLLTVLSFALNSPLMDAFGYRAMSQVTGALALIILFPLIAWFVRRLHDQGKSGWFILIVPISWSLDYFDPGFWAVSVAKVALVVIFLALIFWEPSCGPNRFGPDPRMEQKPEVETGQGATHDG